MKIALIAPPWVPTPPPAYGGTESVIDTLCKGLKKAGHEVVLFATGDSTSPVEVAYHFESAVGVGRVDSTLLELLHVTSAYEMAQHFDIVHDHTLVGPSYGARFPNLAIVTTNHLPFDKGLDEYYRAISSRVPVIAISESQSRAAKGVRLAGVIHHGVDLNDFPSGAGNGGYALFLGRMSPDKGVHRAIEAARASGVPLLIAAKCREQSEVEYYEEVVKPMLGGDVKYLGEVGRQEKIELLADAVCLLNPIAWAEPFGMVMLEALACGTPVIASHLGAVSEIVDDGVTGFVVDTQAELADALDKVATLDRSECRRVVENRFSGQLMVDKHLVAYAKVMGERPTLSTISKLPTRYRSELEAEAEMYPSESVAVNST